MCVFTFDACPKSLYKGLMAIMYKGVALTEIELLRAELWQVKRLAFGHPLAADVVLTPLGERVKSLVKVGAAVAHLCAPAGELPEPSARVAQLREEIQEAMLSRIAENAVH